MAGVDSAGLGEVIHNLIPSFIESRSGNRTLDYIVDRAGVIQVFSLFHLGPVLVLMLSRMSFLLAQQQICPDWYLV